MLNRCFVVYTPYGFSASDSSIKRRLAFNGEVLCEKFAMYFLGNGRRNFSPALQRFVSPDSISPFGAGGLNSYAYCFNDPVNQRDPSGRMSQPSTHFDAPLQPMPWPDKPFERGGRGRVAQHLPPKLKRGGALRTAKHWPVEFAAQIKKTPIQDEHGHVPSQLSIDDPVCAPLKEQFNQYGFQAVDNAFAERGGSTVLPIHRQIHIIGTLGEVTRGHGSPSTVTTTAFGQIHSTTTPMIDALQSNNPFPPGVDLRNSGALGHLRLAEQVRRPNDV